jgi:hypothetical protein
MHYKFRACFFSLICLLLVGCEKPSVSPSNTPVPGSGNTTGTVANFEKIPLPTVNLNNLVIPNLNALYVTNRGPYVQIQDTKKQLWSVYKYHGGSGTSAWSSFTPNFGVINFIPVNFTSEKDHEFSIYWCNTSLSDDKYGMYNLNNGSPSFEFEVPQLPNGPTHFQKLLPAKKGFHRLWAVMGNEIWAETEVAVPKKFKRVALIPEIDFTDPLNAQYPERLLSDPDKETVLWCATKSLLYEIGTVGSGPGTNGGILRSWDFSSVSTTDRIHAVLKVEDAIVLQFGNRVYQQDGSSFKPIGRLNIGQTAVSNICTNGSTIFASDGTYYKASTGTWESFIGNGKNLTGADAARYNELKGYCSSPFAIGVVQGSTQVPVYLLTPTDLIKISPVM